MVTQRQLAAHMRAPDKAAPPPGLEERRLDIYRGLIYRNIEGFIASGFPVLHSILDAGQWHEMVRSFLRDHRCRSPYFLEISREFITFLQSREEPFSWQPPYMLQLCHYEWVELALDIAEGDIPEDGVEVVNPLETVFGVSPFAWRLSYSYPVHKISEQFSPEEELATHLLVYRDRLDKVRFMEINAVVDRLLQTLEQGTEPAGQALRELAADLGFADVEAFVGHGEGVLRDLHHRDVLYTQ